VILVHVPYIKMRLPYMSLSEVMVENLKLYSHISRVIIIVVIYCDKKQQTH